MRATADPAKAGGGRANGALADRPAADLESGLAETAEARNLRFFLERAETELKGAEAKRAALMTKATAIASLAAGLLAIVAAPSLDATPLASHASRWELVPAIGCFLAALVCVARGLTIRVRPGEGISLEELDRWSSDEYLMTEPADHQRVFTRGFVVATKAVRDATAQAEGWISAATAGIAVGLVILAIACWVEAL